MSIDENTAGENRTESRATFINIGERTNVTGSAKFRKLIKNSEFAAALDVARWPDDALALRLAPDEALVITASIALDLDALDAEIAALDALDGTPGYVTETFCRASRYFRPENGERIDAIRDEIAGDETLARRIREKYRIKNTTGYAINSFVDHHDPLDILLHLMVGSEGTLGFVTEALLRLVPRPGPTLTALVFFGSIRDAGAGVAAITAAGISKTSA